MANRPRIEVDLDQQRLWRDGSRVEVPARVFQLLRCFVRNPGTLLTKRAILREVWPTTHVSEASVKDGVKTLRRMLGDDAADPALIETVRGRGYRYLGGIKLRPAPAGGEDAATPALRPRRTNAVFAWLALTCAVLFGAGALYLLAGGDAAQDRADPDGLPAIAVLDFDNISGDPELDLFARGLTVDLKTSLGQVPQVLVSAAGREDPDPADDAATAAALGVRYLLKGAVRREAGLLRISVQMVDAPAGRFLWTGQYDRRGRAFFAMQDEIVLRTLTELRVRLDEGERVRAVSDTGNLQSWLASTAAYAAFLDFTEAGNRRARELWQQALDHDPDRAVPHAGIAFTHYYDAYRGWSADQAVSVAAGIRHADIALRRDPDLPLGHQAKGAILLLEGRVEEGLALRRRAVELAPSDFSAVGGLAAHLTRFGAADESVRLFRRALRLNPAPPLWVPVWFGHALHLDGTPDEAAEWLERAAARAPGAAYVQARLAAVYADLNRTGDARRAAAAARRLAPDLGVAAMARIFPLQDAAARARLDALLRRAGLPE